MSLVPRLHRASAGRVFARVVASSALVAACSSAPSEKVGVDHSSDTGPLGFCRTTTCAPPADYPHADGTCEPPDWSDSPACRDHAPPASNAPLWWRTACVGFDLQEDASAKVSYAAFHDAVTSSFASWTRASCPGSLATATPSIDVRDLGAVSCAKVAYEPNGANRNLLVFHDDAWPYEASDRAHSGAARSPVIALTTVTFDAQTGEILDADVELNSSDYTIVPMTNGAAPDPNGDTFDLQSVLTHELGHFLGLAHSPLADAVMSASGDSDTGAFKRGLRAEDVRGVCAIYPPGGARNVSTLVDPSGHAAEGACDPTPHGGLATSCP